MTALKIRHVPNFDEDWEETTGVHQLSVDMIKMTRASITELIKELKEIKERVECLAGDLEVIVEPPDYGPHEDELSDPPG